MNHLIYILFSPVGRMSRRDFWIGLIVIVVVSMLVYTVIQPDFFTYNEETDSFPPPNLGVKIFDLIMVYPSFAITVKRLNDRDWPRWLPYLILIVSLAFPVGQFFGVFLDIGPSNPIELAGWITFGLLLAFLIIDNGFLRGSIGSNRYGPDPLKQGA